jgi:hypothetical protein
VGKDEKGKERVQDDGKEVKIKRRIWEGMDGVITTDHPLC